MIVYAMRISRISKPTFAALGAPLCAGLLAVPAAAQDDEIVTGGPNMEDVARTPLEILNIDPEDIPQVLLEAVANPYASDTLSGCAAINVEITRLTRVLGPDLDSLVKQQGLTPEKVAQGAIGSLIPFRGIIREVTGAANRQRSMETAILAGSTRRGYLKGLGYSQGCMVPAGPISTAPVELDLGEGDED